MSSEEHNVEEDRKPRAKRGGKTKIKFDTYGQGNEAIAKSAFANCRVLLDEKRKNVRVKGTILRDSDYINQYMQKIDELVPGNIVSASHFSTVEQCAKVFFRCLTTRLALFQLVQICLGLVDILYSTEQEIFIFGFYNTGPLSMVQFVMSKCCGTIDGSKKQIILSIVLTFCCLFIFVEYYSSARKPERDDDNVPNEKFDSVSPEVDLFILKQIIEEQTALAVSDAAYEKVNDEFRREFIRIVTIGTKIYFLHPTDAWAELKAILIIVSIAMMDITDDKQGSENLELIPFIRAFMQDEYFSGSLGALSALLLNPHLIDVSTENHAQGVVRSTVA